MAESRAGVYLREKLKFDTLFKKPTLYLLAALSALVLVLSAAISFRFDAMEAARYQIILFGAFFPAALILLLRALLLQMRYNPYSYNTIYYAGFSLFLIFVIATHFYLAWYALRDPAALSTRQMLYALLYSARNYMKLQLPFIAAFSLALCISNIALIRREGGGLVNLLGIALSALLALGEWVIFFLSGREGSVRDELLLNLFAAIYLYFTCMLIGAIAADLVAALYEPARDKDYLIVPGCAIRADGTPTPILRERLDRALSFCREQVAAGGKAPVFVLSGGQGADEVIPECESMARYLRSKGIPETQIRREGASRDTLENMKYSKQIIAAENPDARIGFSTTNYHVFRAGLKARRVKMRAQGMGAPTKWYFWPNASVREFAGLLTEHRAKQALILLGMIGTYAVMTMLYYGG